VRDVVRRGVDEEEAGGPEAVARFSRSCSSLLLEETVGLAGVLVEDEGFVLDADEEVGRIRDDGGP